MKKLYIPLFISLITACSWNSTSAPIPAQFAGADYILSDKDAKNWVEASHQAEKCIYPNLTRIQQEHFTKEDAYIHAQYVFFYPLEEIIGEDYLKIIQDDEKSMSYAQYQFKKFKQTEFEPLEAAKCNVLRLNARNDLEVVKGQYKNGMAEENKNKNENNKTSDGVATNENKFFFDIIKWGTALLLI